MPLYQEVNEIGAAVPDCGLKTKKRKLEVDSSFTACPSNGISSKHASITENQAPKKRERKQQTKHQATKNVTPSQNESTDEISSRNDES